MTFILIAHDFTDDQALSRRLAARADHLALGDKLKAEGKILYGVALLNEQQNMCGSVLVVDFPSRDELDEWLRIEPYVTGKVWEKIEVTPCKVGPSFI